MRLEYTICDRCGKPVPEATGAIVMIYGGKPTAHLCEKCLDEVLPPAPETMRLVKGAEGVEFEEAAPTHDEQNPGGEQ